MLETGKKCSAIILAAGSGKRMGEDVPKQFLDLAGHPVIFYSLEVFERSLLIGEVVIVTGKDWVQTCRDHIVGRYGFKKVTGIVSGGDTRCASLCRGMKVCSPDTDLVFIHDAARPFIDEEMLERGYEEAVKHGNAVASVRCKDTVRMTDEDGKAVWTPDRSLLRMMQTPQIFRYSDIMEACSFVDESIMESITDDASLIERLGNNRIYFFEGSYENIKITTPEDMDLAEAIKKRKREGKSVRRAKDPNR